METISSLCTDMLIGIEGINEPVIYEYFAKLNNNEFRAAADLFAEQGLLSPSFEKTIQGRNEISQYLEKEAKEIMLYPSYGKIIATDRLVTQYQIQGKVQTSYFTVNLNWLIYISNHKEILFVEVKLLASLKELLNFIKG